MAKHPPVALQRRESFARMQHRQPRRSTYSSIVLVLTVLAALAASRPAAAVTTCTFTLVANSAGNRLDSGASSISCEGDAAPVALRHNGLLNATRLSGATAIVAASTAGISVSGVTELILAGSRVSGLSGAQVRPLRV